LKHARNQQCRRPFTAGMPPCGGPHHHWNPQLVAQIFTSWNRIVPLLRHLNGLREAA
jgi:hypothetical protein